jgi:hypothetical protein
MLSGGSSTEGTSSGCLKHCYVLLYDDGQVAALVSSGRYEERSLWGDNRNSSLGTSQTVKGLQTGTSGDDDMTGGDRDTRSQPCFYLAQVFHGEENGTDDNLERHFSQLNTFCLDRFDKNKVSTFYCSNTEEAASSTTKIDDTDDLLVLRAIVKLQPKLLRDCLPGPVKSPQEQAVGSSPVKRSKQPKEWDPSILFTICRWRSCLAPASFQNDSCLCSYHQSLGEFLNDASSATSLSALGRASSRLLHMDASKFLPRLRPPNVENMLNAGSASDGQLEGADRDLFMIKASSTLIQEMWDGKLKSTVHSYLKKILKEHGLRTRLLSHAAVDGMVADVIIRKRRGAVPKRDETREKDLLPARPTWIHWKDASEFNRYSV